MERSANETRFLIPAKKGWMLVFTAAWLAFWVTVPLFSLRRALDALRAGGTVHPFDLLWCIGWVYGTLIAVWTILRSLGGKEYLRRTLSHLNLEATIFGFAYRRRWTPLDDVRNLRYVPSSRTPRPHLPRGRHPL